MSTVSQSIAVPLREDADGALRVGQTRLLLELVIHEFDNGATPESIVDSYPVVELPDVYSVLAYYLNHRDEVQEYLSRRDKQAAIIRAKIEGSQEDLGDLRHRIQQMKVKRD